MRVTNWRAQKRIFHGQHPWTTRVFEVVTGLEGPSAGSLVILDKNEVGPNDLVPAFFALAGVWRRVACGGWFNHEDQPAPQGDFALAWDSFRKELEADQPVASDYFKGRYQLLPMDAAEVDERVRMVLRILDCPISPSGEALLRVGAPGRLVVDGKALAEKSLALRLEVPWLRGLSASACWNMQLFAGETARHFVLVDWSTGA
jgi:hypothetical protein